ncbi:MAG: HAMP domain-containing sensor histidine kinase [bacterium]|nr:HAMP domain-containing sensor histidine kinase [bacterium]
MLLEFFTFNLDLVFFVYGLAFYVMGVAILIQPRKEESVFKLAEFIWLLGAFGISHGVNEWLDMFILVKRFELGIWHIIRMAVLTVSFVFLFEFGRKLVSLNINKLLSGWITVCLCAVTIVFIFTFKEDPTIWPRYFLGLPGGLMSALGFFWYQQKNKDDCEKFGIGKYFLWAAASMGLYSIFTGIVVPKGGFPPASFINNTSFLNFFNIPVQVLRAVCAAAISRAIWNILSVFNREIISDLRESLDKLKHSEDLVTMGKFAGIMGHEFRNQLAVMKSSLYFIDMKFQGVDEKTKHHLETLKKQITETDNIIEDILMFAKGRQIDFKDVNLKNIILHSVSAIRNSEKIKIIIEIDKDLPIIKGDEIKLDRCFVNIVLNAVQAMEDGGKLLISADKTGNFINIIFKDTGCGIKTQDKERIFEPFFTNKKGGTGLGLSTCRIIVDAHKGHIDVKSEVNKGTTVKITLPIIQNWKGDKF